MRKNSEIAKLMLSELPCLSYQKRAAYRTTYAEVLSLYRLINQEVFNNKLLTAEIKILNKTPCYWGYCIAKKHFPNLDSNQSVCVIKLSEKWYCKQWLINVLAHEMVHQYQFEVDGLKRMRKGLKPIMSHGPSFFVFREKLKKYGISLKKSHSRILWFKHQDLFKC